MSLYKSYFITGIGTGVGKTLVSAIITEAIKADYFKPVQCGGLDYTDTDFVRDHLFNSKSKVHNENFTFRLAASPHIASVNEGKKISLKDIVMPESKNHLLIEGAGGALVPLNDKQEYIIDIAKKNKLPVILVCDYYLGSINHSLLTLNYLSKAKIPVSLIVFNGDKVESTRKAILTEAGDIPYIEIEKFEVNANAIKEQADRLSADLNRILLT